MGCGWQDSSVGDYERRHCERSEVEDFALRPRNDSLWRAYEFSSLSFQFLSFGDEHDSGRDDVPGGV